MRWSVVLILFLLVPYLLPVLISSVASLCRAAIIKKCIWGSMKYWPFLTTFCPFLTVFWQFFNNFWPNFDHFVPSFGHFLPIFYQIVDLWVFSTAHCSNCGLRVFQAHLRVWPANCGSYGSPDLNFPTVKFLSNFIIWPLPSCSFVIIWYHYQGEYK